MFKFHVWFMTVLLLLLLLLLLLVAVANAAFLVVPPRAAFFSATTTTTTTTRTSTMTLLSPYQSTLSTALSSTTETVSEEEEEDPFDNYGVGSDLAFKELKTGTSGEVADDGKVLNVSYKGLIWSSRIEFDSKDDFMFKMGAGNVMPGFEQGLRGAQVGTKRIVRIPPSLAYGPTQRGPIPPNSDLEFEIQVNRITSGIGAELELFGTGRAIGVAACIMVMAVAPLIEKVLPN